MSEFNWDKVRQLKRHIFWLGCGFYMNVGTTIYYIFSNQKYAAWFFGLSVVFAIILGIARGELRYLQALHQFEEWQKKEEDNTPDKF